MARMKLTSLVSNLIGKPLKQRKMLLAKIAKLQAKVAEIEAAFAEAGLPLAGDAPVVKKVKLGGKPGRKPGKRTRGKFGVSGEQSVIDFVKKAGNPSTAEINAHWKKEGRGGSANNTITKLFKEKLIKRVKSEDVRGSRYSAA